MTNAAFIRQRTMLSDAIRGHMAELLEIIANEDSDCIPVAATMNCGTTARGLKGCGEQRLGTGREFL